MEEKSIMKKGFILFFLLLIVFFTSGVGGAFITPDRLNWYKTLPLSSLTPPDMWFSIVWSGLYLLMAISAFLVWDKASPRFFVLQLITNGLWPFLFFYMHSPIGALVDILFMLVFLFLCIKTFYKVSKTAAYLLVPTFAWALFALYLNAHIVYYQLLA